MSRHVTLPPHRRGPEQLTERQLQDAIIHLARTLGWEVYHPWLSAHSERGWPDLSLAKPPRLVLAELKSERGKLSDAQRRWLDLLGRCEGVEVYVWRPADMSAPGGIVEVLSGRARHRWLAEEVET